MLACSRSSISSTQQRWTIPLCILTARPPYLCCPIVTHRTLFEHDAAGLSAQVHRSPILQSDPIMGTTKALNCLQVNSEQVFSSISIAHSCAAECHHAFPGMTGRPYSCCVAAYCALVEIASCHLLQGERSPAPRKLQPDPTMGTIMALSISFKSTQCRSL